MVSKKHWQLNRHLVITSVDNDDGSIDVQPIEQLTSRYILREN